MRDFKTLHVWQKSHQLALSVYKATGFFPKDELYTLTSQLRRSVISIPSNISEGCGRHSEKEFAHFLSIAHGSASEVEYQLLLAKDLDYLTETDHNRLNTDVTEIKKMLNSFIQKLNSK